MLHRRDKELLVDRCLVGGNWAGTPTDPVVDPATSATIARRAAIWSRGGSSGGRGGAGEPFRDGRVSWPSSALVTPRKWFDLIISHKNDIALLLTAEQGKPLAAVVGAKSLLMPAGEGKLPQGCTVRFQLVGHADARCEPLTLWQLKQVENFDFAVDCAPEIQPLAGDRHYHLVKAPPVRWPRPLSPQVARDCRAEFQYPTADHLVAHVNAALGEQISTSRWLNAKRR
jgi:hypothetical protein